MTTSSTSSKSAEAGRRRIIEEPRSPSAADLEIHEPFRLSATQALAIGAALILLAAIAAGPSQAALVLAVEVAIWLACAIR